MRAAVAALLALGVAGFSAPPPAPDDSVVVTGKRASGPEVRAQASGFIRRVASLPSTGQFARWADPVCVAVIGLEKPLARRVITRINDMADEVGARVGDAKCHPNIVVIFATDASAWMAAMLARQPQLLVNATLDERKMICSGPIPVRWWYNTRTDGGDGQSVGHNSPALISNPGGMVSNGNALTMDSYSSSLIDSQLRSRISSAVVIVDVTRATGATLGAVASYAGFVTLSRTRMGTRFVDGGETILGLFPPDGDPDGHVTGISDWDRAYLKALYRIPANRSGFIQRNALATEMLKHLPGMP